MPTQIIPVLVNPFIPDSGFYFVSSWPWAENSHSTGTHSHRLWATSINGRHLKVAEFPPACVRDSIPSRYTFYKVTLLSQHTVTWDLHSWASSPFSNLSPSPHFSNIVPERGKYCLACFFFLFFFFFSLKYKQQSQAHSFLNLHPNILVTTCIIKQTHSSQKQKLSQTQEQSHSLTSASIPLCLSHLARILMS